MTSPVAIGAIVYLFALIPAMAYVERRVAATEPLIDAPSWVRTSSSALAIGGPWLVYFADLVPGSDGAVAIAAVGTAAAVLWLAADRLVGVIDQGSTSVC
jgi:hypothetical protein